MNVYAVSSDNGTVITTPVVNYSSPNNTGTLTFAPTGGFGAATVTVTVDNGGVSNNLVSQTFTVAVVAAPLPPSINTLTNVTIYQNSGPQTIALSGINPVSIYAGVPVTVAAASGNPAVVLSYPSVSYTSPNSSGMLTITPAANAVGSAMVSVTVNNGGYVNGITTQSFMVSVVAPPTPPVPSTVPTIGTISNITVLEGTLRNQSHRDRHQFRFDEWKQDGAVERQFKQPAFDFSANGPIYRRQFGAFDAAPWIQHDRHSQRLPLPR